MHGDSAHITPVELVEAAVVAPVVADAVVAALVVEASVVLAALVVLVASVVLVALVAVEAFVPVVPLVPVPLAEVFDVPLPPEPPLANVEPFAHPRRVAAAASASKQRILERVRARSPSVKARRAGRSSGLAGRGAYA